ncbi:polysaccharide deacetylase family protein [bacterium]|nr:polysaccharide deacetylase family protein [bacterium]
MMNGLTRNIRNLLARQTKRSMMLVRHRIEGDDLAGGVFTHDNFGRNVCFTFDDGPRRHFTEETANCLGELGIRGAFFVQGRRCEKYPEIVRRLDELGHVIGNHTYDHPKLLEPTPEVLRDQILRTQNIVDEILKDRYPDGYPHRYFRPPYGLPWMRGGDRHSRRIVRSFLREHGFRLVMWQVDSSDWRWPAPEEIAATVRHLIVATQGGAILFHDSHAALVRALEQIAGELVSDGYRIVPLTELERRRDQSGWLMRGNVLARLGSIAALPTSMFLDVV